MSQSAAWVAVTLDAVAGEEGTSPSDAADLRQAAEFVRVNEEEFNETDTA